MINRLNCKHIIWDWNGTLFDDAWLCMEITNDLLEKHNLPAMTRDYYREVFDFPVKKYYEKIGFDFSNQSYESLADEFILRYETRRFECGLHPDAKEILSLIHMRGVSQSILSAYSQVSLEEIIRYFSLDSYFVTVSGLTDHYANSKIEIGKRHISKLGFPVTAMVLIGDTMHDYTVANAIGVDCFLIPNGHQNKKRLESISAQLIESLADVKHITTQSS